MKSNALIYRMNEEMRLRCLSNSTISNYEREVTEFFDYLQIGNNNPSQEQIREYLLYLLDKNVGYAKYKMALHSINYLFKKVLKIQWKIAPVPYPKNIKKLPVVLSCHEIKKLIYGATNEKSRCILNLMYCAGLRRRELTNLLITDVDKERMQLFIRKSKGCKDRYVPISNKTLQMLRNYYKQYRPQKYLFNGYRKAVPISDSALRHILKNALSNTTIKKTVCLHTLRHSFATHLLEKGIPITVLQHFLGHSRLLSTLTYLRIIPGHLTNYHNFLEGLDI